MTNTRKSVKVPRDAKTSDAGSSDFHFQTFEVSANFFNLSVLLKKYRIFALQPEIFVSSNRRLRDTVFVTSGLFILKFLAAPGFPFDSPTSQIFREPSSSRLEFLFRKFPTFRIVGPR